MQENDNKIIELYNSGLTIVQVGEKLGINRDTIWRRLIKNNIKRRDRPRFQTKTPIDPNYFKQIDTEFKAYYLGFMYADGCMIQGDARLSLAEKDKNILNKFNDYLFNGKKKIIITKERFFIGTTGNRKGKNYHASPIYIFSIKNKEIYQDLIKLGCTPRKTFTLKFPTFDQVPEYLMCHFIRGYFDGDGCICVQKNKNMNHTVSIISSNSFCEGLHFFLNKLDIKNSIKSRKNVKVLYIYNKKGILDFYNFIYKDETFFLERKRDKFNIEYLNSIHTIGVIVDGIKYNSLNKASKFLKVSIDCISDRCKSNKFPNYQFT